MKRKLVIVLVVFLLSVLVVVLGALFKIQHWNGGSELLLLGFSGQLAASLGLVIVLVKRFFLKK